MKARQIRLTGNEVRAILDGRKTQHRIPIKSQPVLSKHMGFCWKGGAYGIGADDAGTRRNFTRSACTLGKPDDLLWVRETWWQQGTWVIPGYPEAEAEDSYWSWHKSDEIGYRANMDQTDICLGPGCIIRKRPSIHMPRWSSRITLEITGVRVERLQSISIAGCMAEGIASYGEGWTNGLLGPFSDPRLAFADLWDSTGGDWSSNPWVWVIEFKPIMANVDEVLRERQEAA